MSNCKTEQTAVATDMCPTVSLYIALSILPFEETVRCQSYEPPSRYPPTPRPNTAPSHVFLFWPTGLACDVTGSHAPSLLAVGHAKDTVHRQNCCSELWSALTASGDTMELWGRIVDVELRRALWTVTENRCFDWTDGFVPCCDRLTSSCCGVQCCTYQDLAALCCCQSVCTARTAQCSVVTTCVHWNDHNKVTVNERSFVATAVVTHSHPKRKVLTLAYFNLKAERTVCVDCAYLCFCHAIFARNDTDVSLGHNACYVTHWVVVRWPQSLLRSTGTQAVVPPLPLLVPRRRPRLSVIS